MIDLKVDDVLDSMDPENDGGLVTNPTVIKIVGCGGGGSSAVKRMIEAGVSDVDFFVINTDVQALKKSPAQNRIPIGRKLTGGLGAGGNPHVGEEAANEDADTIKQILDGSDMVIITAGMGGGTGTGSAPVVAKLAHDAGILTIAVVTTPFGFEGPVRMKYASEGIEKLRDNVDSLIVIPNEQVTKIVDKKLNYLQAFRLADNVLCQGVQGISEIITVPGEMNLDFNDVRSVMKNAGEAILGVGFGEGENRIVDAAQAAISNPLLENRTIDGAKKLLINICSDENLAMSEVEDVVNNIKASADKNVEVFVGLVNNPDMNGKLAITVIATGFNDEDCLSVGSDDDGDSKTEDIFDYNDFQSALNGRKFASKTNEDFGNSIFGFNDSKKDEPAVESKISTVGLGKSLFENLGTDLYEEDKSTDFSAILNSSSTAADEPESETEETAPVEEKRVELPKVDKNDLSVPAWMRNGRSSLSSRIKLTDD